VRIEVSQLPHGFVCIALSRASLFRSSDHECLRPNIELITGETTKEKAENQLAVTKFLGKDTCTYC